MSYWTVPPMWTGRTVAVLASGPSMSQAVADAVRHLPRIAVNTTYQLARDAEVVYASDATWWAKHPEAALGPGIKASIELVPRHAPKFPYDVVVLRNTGVQGFDPDPACLRTTGNSGGCAIQIAVHARAARILLLGFDMRGGHWHGPHPKGLSNPSSGFLERSAAAIARMARMITGVEIINCTPGSALRCFPMMSLDEALSVELAA